SSENEEINGRWFKETISKSMKIRLNKLHEFNSYDHTVFNNLEILQPESTNEHYFKLLISKDLDEAIEVKGVRIYEQNTDRLIQDLGLECRFWCVDNISVFDYNDAVTGDFSVLPGSYAGPNTAS